jgi:acyl-coenzyme A synthetase/AMP-(fatty) acid ligase
MLIHRIYERALTRIDAPAVCVGGERLGYRAFAMLIAAARRHLLEAKPPGAVFALIGATGLDGWILTIAARATGLHTIVLRAPAQIEELNLGASAVVLLMGPNPAFASAAAANGSSVVAIPANAFDDTPSLDAAQLPRDSACGGHILLTSGTTGRYKKVMIDCAAEAARAMVLGNQLRFGARTVLFMGPMGLWTSAGHNRPVATWYAGGCVVIDNSDNMAGPIVRDGVNHLQLTVPFLSTIIEQLPDDFARNDAIRIGLVGSSPTWSLVERTRAKLTRDIVVELGSTEGGTIAMTRIERPEDLLSHKLLRDRKVMIVDDTGTRTPEGVPGLLKIRLRDRDVRSYYDEPEETARFFDRDWFLPGDIARIADGKLELLGRVTDVISINGDKHSTLPFERALERRFSVSGAAVLSAPNKDGEDEVHVVLETTERQLTAEAASLSAMFPVFSRVHVSVLDALPRNHMGKIDRMQLRKLLGLGVAAPEGGDDGPEPR